MVSGGERCADRMRGGVNGRNSVGPSILYEGLRSITRNYHSLAMGSGRDGRDQLLRRRVDGEYGIVVVVGGIDTVTRGRDANTTGATPGGDCR